MGLADDLTSEVEKIFKARWEVRDGQVVPESEDLTLSNTGVKLDATVLYADLDGSTNLVDQYLPGFAAEIYKTYLHCAAKIIKSEGGVITAYDGDRVMAVL
jgi:class 3 adenylate cyclase